MSSRRKRAPPVRVDDETKKKLDWNMHEDRRSEAIILDDDHILSSESSLVSSLAVGKDDIEASCSNSLVLAEPGQEPSCSSSEKPAPFRLALVPVSDGDQAWRVLLGEFYLTSSFPMDLEDNRFALQRSGDRLSMFPLEDAGPRDESDQTTMSDFLVECSLAVSVLEDLEWLQRRRIIQLCHKQDRVSIKVGIYLLEAGLGRPEFLSEGNSRIRKVNQLMQRLMEFFYDFIIPEVVEGEEGKCDTELERQNVEELYDYVRHLHQVEGLDLRVKVQHEALIPVLRPYQCQAVNWMLKKERYGKDAATQGVPVVYFPSIFHESLSSTRSPCAWILSGSTGQGQTSISQRI